MLSFKTYLYCYYWLGFVVDCRSAVCDGNLLLYLDSEPKGKPRPEFQPITHRHRREIRVVIYRSRVDHLVFGGQDFNYLKFLNTV